MAPSQPVAPEIHPPVFRASNAAKPQRGRGGIGGGRDEIPVKLGPDKLIAKPPGLRTPTTETQSARRTHREKKNENFKVELARMLYVGIIDMMIITPVYGRPPWGKRAQKESRVNFKY